MRALLLLLAFVIVPLGAAQAEEGGAGVRVEADHESPGGFAYEVEACASGPGELEVALARTGGPAPARLQVEPLVRTGDAACPYRAVATGQESAASFDCLRVTGRVAGEDGRALTEGTSVVCGPT